MKAVILQPSYIPWRGYFHQILKADVFVFLDDVQYDRRGWRARNRIKTQQGPLWLTIPVFNKGSRAARVPINAIEIDWSQGWADRHWTTLQHAYGRAPFFRDYAALVEGFYARRDRLLADFDMATTIELARTLGFGGTRFVSSSSLAAGAGGVEGKTERLLGILREIGSTHYITGPAARAYIDEARFAEAGVTLEYMRYDYPEYPQLHPPYEPQVSILDLLFMTGPQARSFIEREAS